MNNVSLVGRVTKDPELKYVAGDKKLTSFTLAVSRKFKNQLGGVEADFIYCTIWGSFAENIVRYCGKGSLIGVSGRLYARSYNNSEGKRVYVTDVVAEEVKFYSLKSPQQITAIEKTDFELPVLLTEQVKLD